MNLYPLEFKAIYKDKLWGGNKLETHFNRNIPTENTGESWEIAAHKNGTSIVKNGYLVGKNLDYLITSWPYEMMGSMAKDTNSFPLLIKLLDVSNKLSVQVHPGPDYPGLPENENGKTEMWYILSAKPGARLIYGLKKGVSYKQFKNAVYTGNIKKYLNRIHVKAGDVIFIPAGTVHGIEDGILLAEIQQNSDTTYRLYDWDRTNRNGKKRPLHIEKALEVINFNFEPELKNRCLSYENENYIRNYLAACSYFAVEKIEIKKEYQLNTGGNKFYILLAIEGEGTMDYNNKKYKLNPGQTFYIPATLGKISITGKSKLLLTYFPEKKKEFINKLIMQGFSSNEINSLTGINEW